MINNKLKSETIIIIHQGIIYVTYWKNFIELRLYRVCTFKKFRFLKKWVSQFKIKKKMSKDKGSKNVKKAAADKSEGKKKPASDYKTETKGKQSSNEPPIPKNPTKGDGK